MAHFTLRPMDASDGPAIDTLMRSEAPMTEIALTTRYRHDIYASLLAQHPTMFGVVATMPGVDGLVGMATAFTSEVNVGGRPVPSATLENLKVRHDVRRQGLGARLAAWRVDEAHRRMAGDGIVMTMIDASNTASLATAGQWATQILGPVRIVIARVRSKPPKPAGVRIRPIEPGDLETVAAGVNEFYAGYNLYPPQTATRLAASLEPSALGEPIRAYRVAVTDDGTIVAGAQVTERFKLMTDHLDHVPRPLELLARIVPLIPPDRVIRTAEVHLAWYAPGRAAAGRHLWDAVRYEWRDRATNVVALADPRGSLAEMVHIGPTVIPTVRLMAPVQHPERLDPERPIYLWR
jgi:GNAT superfamily N-acetyltransferase